MLTDETFARTLRPSPHHPARVRSASINRSLPEPTITALPNFVSKPAVVRQRPQPLSLALPLTTRVLVAICGMLGMATFMLASKRPAPRKLG